MAISETTLKDTDPDADRRAEQEGRPARPEARGGGRRSGLGLAAVRREGARAAREGQGRGRLRLLDVGVAQVGAAGVREEQRPALLPGAVRGRGVVEERDLHRRRAEPAGDSGGRLPDEGRRREALGARRHRLRLSAHHQQDPRGLPEVQGRRGRGHLDQLHAVRPLRLADARRGDQAVRLGRQEDRGRLDHQRRRQRAVLQGARQPEGLGRGHSGRRLLGRRRGAVGPRHQAAGRPPGGLELLPEHQHAGQQGVHQPVEGLHQEAEPHHQRSDGSALHRLQPVGEGGREGQVDRRRARCWRRCPASRRRT